MMDRARSLANEPGTYLTNQMYNRDSLKGYELLGAELLAQLDGPLTAFCAAVGTGGLLMGAARALRRASGRVRWWPSSRRAPGPFDRTSRATHHVEGIGVGFRAAAPRRGCKKYDEVRGIEEAEARQMVRRLAAEEGILAGTSTGVNVVGALLLARSLAPDTSAWSRSPATAD